MGSLLCVGRQGWFLGGHAVREGINCSVSAVRDPDDPFYYSSCPWNGLQMGLQSVPLNSERLGGLDIASPRPRPAREYLRRLVAAGSVSADTFWCYYWPSSLNSTRRTFPIHFPFENILGPCTQIVHTLLPNGTLIIPTPNRNGFPVTRFLPGTRPHARIWPALWFPRVLLVLEDPRGISGPGMGRESKGSAFPGQSDVSDQNAGRRDNLQTPPAPRTRFGVRRPRGENPEGPPVPARHVAKS
jgi:hypothetical protein